MNFIDSSNNAVDNCINEVFDKIAVLVEPTYSKELANFAKEIFDSAGHENGRSWDNNTESTAKRKGFDHRNRDTGFLENEMTTDGFLMDDDYMDKLDEKYHFANDVGDGKNSFDDIGQRESDQEILVERTINSVVENYK